MFTISLCSLIIACGDKTEDTSEDVDTADEVSEPAEEETEAGEEEGSEEGSDGDSDNSSNGSSANKVLVEIVDKKITTSIKFINHMINLWNYFSVVN